MSRYLSEARHYARQIQHYFEHGGAKGYTASLPYFQELGALMQRAKSSKKGKKDVPLIHAIYKEMKGLMAEMEIRTGWMAHYYQRRSARSAVKPLDLLFFCRFTISDKASSVIADYADCRC